MTAMIEFTQESFDRLAGCLADGSSLRVAFQNAAFVFGPDGPESFVVYCSEDEVQALLEIAKRHCPQAVWEIGRRKYL
ncbi:MAG: hypothetical protein ACREX3_24610 [Gammaproteobacteria bacterium]